MNIVDTIIAPATAPGEGGIAIVRISGADALSALLQYFKPSASPATLESHHLYHGYLRDQSDCLIDEVMAVYMAAPHTYTRDDVVEIQCHGSQQVVKAILNLYQQYGFRLAEPGEFTYRAFISGRLDLSQAEAVSSLIHAKTDSSRKLALDQVGGALSREICSATDSLKRSLVLVEAWIDFPEEDLPKEDLASIVDSVEHIKSKISTITDSYAFGRVLCEGASVLLLGQPNVGKSSLLNALLGEERAIVTEVPGTTRDFLEEGCSINGIPLRLVDTAGLRKSGDVVEVEGVRRAEEKIASADLLLWVVDSSKQLDELDIYVHSKCLGVPGLLVLTKSDLVAADNDISFCDFPVCRVSSKNGAGLLDLRGAISGCFSGDQSSVPESVMLTERRHYETLLFCFDSLERVSMLLDGESALELIAFELRESLHYLGKISGETSTEELLDDIFSGFCIGK